MKVVCEGCRAKYQVPDERVAGRKLRIKCRRCGNGIIVRGDQLAVSSPVAEPIGDEWHVSFEDLEQGPMEEQQLLKWLGMRGDRWDAFVWCEAIVDWQPARNVAKLIDAVGGAVPDNEDDSPTQMVQSPLLMGEQRAQASDLRASETADPFSDPSYPPMASNERTPAPPAEPAYEPSLPATSSSPRVSAEQAMTGTRNEESVLFSAASLRQVAASSSTSIAAGSDASKALKGYASGDGSGLIDIAALASLSEASSTDADSGASSSPPRDMGNTPMTATVQRLARPEESSSMLPVAIFGGALVVAAGLFMAIVMTQKPVAPVAAAAPAAPVAAPVVAAAVLAPVAVLAPAAVAPPVAEVATADAPSEPSAEVKAPATDSPAPAVAAKPASGARKVKPRLKAKTTGKPRAALAKVAAKKKKKKKNEDIGIDDILAPSAPVAKKQAPKKVAPKAKEVLSVDDILGGAKPKDKSNSIDDLLSGATVPGAKRLSSAPSRDAVIAAMKGVSSAVRRCAKKHNVTGVAKAAIKVSGDTGRVTSAKVTGVNGPVSECISTAVSKARFPKFAKPSFSLKYPFKLK